MKQLTTILIDDERLARVELKNSLKRISWVTILAEAANAKEGIAMIREHQPDFIFLDIHMPGQSGFDMLEELEEAPLVIFMTAYDEYAIKAFEFNALDYLLKPVNEERLKSALERVFHLHESKNKETVKAESVPPFKDQLYLKDGNQHYFVALSKISLFSSFGNYVKVHFGEKAILVHRSLNLIESRIRDEQFFRANRYSIINMRHITEVRQGNRGKLLVLLNSGHEIELSERKSVLFREKWGV